MNVKDKVCILDAVSAFHYLFLNFCNSLFLNIQICYLNMFYLRIVLHCDKYILYIVHFVKIHTSLNQEIINMLNNKNMIKNMFLNGMSHCCY